MELSTLAALALVGIGIWTLRQLFVPESTSAWRKAVEQVARTYGGTVERSSSGYPAAYFTFHAERPWRVVVRRVRSVSLATELLADWPPSPMALAISSPGKTLIAGIPGGVRLDTSGDEILCRYRVVTNAPVFVRARLEDTLKWCLESVRQFLPTAALELRIENGQFALRKMHTMEAAGQLDRFVWLALRCLDQFAVAMLDDPGDDVELASATPVTGKCPICGELMDGAGNNVWRCERCHTPHHADCWSYAGQCGVFGCGGGQCNS